MSPAIFRFNLHHNLVQDVIITIHQWGEDYKIGGGAISIPFLDHTFPL